MGFIGIVQVEDGKSRSGVGLSVNADGSADVSIKSAPTLQVEGSVEVTAGSVEAVTSPRQGDAVTSAVAVSTTSVELLAANPDRVGCSIFNQGSGTVFLAWDGTASAATGFPLPAGQRFDLPCSVGNTQQIQAIAASGSQDVRIVEFTAP